MCRLWIIRTNSNGDGPSMCQQPTWELHLVHVRDGQIRLSRDRELDYAEWWDGKGEKETLPHVRAILRHRDIPFPRRNWLVRLFRRLLFLGP